MSLLLDLSFVAGVACLAHAGQMVHPALAWAVPGVALMAFAVAGAIARGKKGSK